ncbi:ABC-type transporter MlaC component [Aestuariispira insulae]|uniref:ABC-type transporter MlaC component n=1 Tax=Aestuariispira insulae TaxID=1461337 RepID=A0A3D9HWV5_9PROT|nr:ABC-type transporter MlaC component [Aestuariispira insulae]
MRRIFFTFFLACFVAFSGQANASGSQTDLKAAEKFVSALGERTIKSLKGRSVDDPKRVTLMRDLLAESLDIERIGRIVLGTQWRKVDKSQQKAYQEIFREYALMKYAVLVSGYDGETFSITNSQQAGRSDAMVFTDILKDGKPLAAVGWRITTQKGELKILDVKVEKISMVQTEKSQFQTVLQKEGFDGLLSQLQQQLDKMEAKLASN